MALNKQIWQNTIVENFFPENSFASKSVDDSQYVNFKTVHIPNAGVPSGVKKNRASYPATAATRADHDKEYSIDEFTTDPVHITNAETVELSYDKRNSVISQDRQQLIMVAHESLLREWAKSATIERCTGKTVEAEGNTATGYRKTISKADVSRLQYLFNKSNIPAENRFILLDARMYQELIDDLTEKELMAFQQAADVKKGIVGQLYGFNIMERSSVLVENGGSIKDFGADGGAADNLAGIVWQQDCVSRALGEVKMFSNTDDATYYGDVYSFLVRTGGSKRRYDNKGVIVLAQDAASAPVETSETPSETSTDTPGEGEGE